MAAAALTAGRPCRAAAPRGAAPVSPAADRRSSRWRSACSWRSSTSRSSPPRSPRSRPACRPARRDRLGADRLSDRRDRHDPAVGLPVAGAVDALSVHDLGGRLHHRERAVRDRHHIEQMIVYRALQGFIGGGMIPTVFAAAFTDLPAASRAMVTAMVGLIATLAPTIGPTVGGYLTNAFSWHWLFLVNVVPGHRGDASRPGPGRLRQAELRAASSGSTGRPRRHGGLPRRLEYVLEEGAAQRLVPGRQHRHLRRSSSVVGGGAVLLRGRSRPRSRSSISGLHRPQFRLRLAVLLRARHRPLRPHLPLSAVPRRASAATIRC